MEDWRDKLLWLAVGAVVGWFGQVASRRYSIRTDAIGSRIDETCDAADELANVASKYWALSPRDANLAAIAREVRVKNHALRSLVGYLGDDINNLTGFIDEPLERLSELATGGNFDVMGRAADPSLELNIRTSATEFKLACRVAERSYFRAIL